MSGPHVLNPHPPEFERFLYASVGEDRHGSVVTVLSALARLNLDPWTEAADLAALGREAAATRFGILLSRVRDVPALGQNHGSMGRELTRLLPVRASRLRRSGPAPRGGNPITSGVFWAILVLLFLMAQLMFGGLTGTGE